jgi:hypothetical protein
MSIWTKIKMKDMITLRKRPAIVWNTLQQEGGNGSRHGIPLILAYITMYMLVGRFDQNGCSVDFQYSQKEILYFYFKMLF